MGFRARCQPSPVRRRFRSWRGPPHALLPKPNIAECGNEFPPGDKERSDGQRRGDSEQDGYDGIHGLRSWACVLSPERRCLMDVPQGPSRRAFAVTACCGLPCGKTVEDGWFPAGNRAFPALRRTASAKRRIADQIGAGLFRGISLRAAPLDERYRIGGIRRLGQSTWKAHIPVL